MKTSCLLASIEREREIIVQERRIDRGGGGEKDDIRCEGGARLARVFDVVPFPREMEREGRRNVISDKVFWVWVELLARGSMMLTRHC